VTQAAINTLVFKKLETGISLFEKIAWLISRVEYFVANLGATTFNASEDYMTLALVATDQLTGLAITNNAVLDLLQICRYDWGAAANGGLREFPYTKDFSTLPGGGLLVPPNPLYLGVSSSGLALVASVTAKIFYTTYELAVEEYWELVESRRMISS
jgi:hypothetical protein